ncbi:uncharacterized protein PV06_09224 [Exophiala oligosperma]|uniref:Uncharacterized protein n=1 Tax=Exophiala oligosperma TaxID=215243 RepID=A0A0D2ADF4_9EURO|nr:uncharacterized protein PV06_09224 [Exophiala oligosperma]KIW38241.1 hypothetical protein PV06_09224 [Exophiala oligosperma]
MISPTPIVPSKNALRALRRLALSPPAVVVVGAVGSLCGAAVVHCEIRRQLILAERIIETKKVLRSLTNGSPADRLKEMFEAAERGEDVTSPEWRAKRRRREIGRRSFSTISRTTTFCGNDDGGGKEDSIPREEDHKISCTQKRIVPRYHPVPRIKESISNPKTHFTTSGSRIHRGKHVWQSRDKREPSFAEFRFSSQSTNIGSLSNRRLPAHHHYNTSRQKQTNDAYIPHGSSDQNFTDRSIQGRAMRTTLMEEDPVILSERAHDDESTMPLLDAGLKTRTSLAEDNIVTSLPFRPLSTSPHQSSTKAGGRSIFRELLVAPEPTSSNQSYKQSTSKDLKDYARKDLPWPNSRPSWSSWMMNKSTTEQTHTALDNEFCSYRRNAQQYGPHWPKRSRVFESPRLETGIDELEFIPYSIRSHFTKNVNPRIYLELQNFIRPKKLTLTYEERLRRWSAAMRYYTQHNAPNWAMAEAIFYSWRFSFRPDDLICAPVMKLISYLLATAPTSERLQEIFFPSSVPGRHKDHLYSLAPRYLAIFCEDHDEKSCVAELAKIHRLAQRSKLSHKDQAFVPVLRKALRKQDPGQRDDLIDAVIAVYGENVRPYILSQCALLYTSSGDWIDVEEMLSQIHTTGHSRTRVYQFSSLFNDILRRYLETNSASQGFEFLIGGIKDAGLVPLHGISTTIICALVKEKRFSLVGEWVRIVRETFPRCKLGFDMDTDAWKLGQALRTTGATCQQVAEVCRGISLGCRDDPFSPVLKDFVKEIMKRDVTERFQTLAEHRPSLAALDNYLQSVPLSQLIDVASRICTSQRLLVGDGDVFDGLIQDLASQLNGIDEIKSIFAGDFSLAQLKPPGAYQPDMSSSGPLLSKDSWSSSSTPETQTMVSELVERAELSDIVYIQEIVAEHYDLQKDDNHPVNHLLLERLLVRLSSNRPCDALGLVESVYARNYIQCVSGKGLGNDIFLKWLELVEEVGDTSSASEVLWAILDSSSQLEWSFDFTTLVDIVGRKFMGSCPPKGEPQDVTYLVDRIQRLKETLQDSKPVHDDFRFPPWREWEENFRDNFSLTKRVSSEMDKEEMLEEQLS